jgi:hypothetical protein
MGLQGPVHIVALPKQDATPFVVMTSSMLARSKAASAPNSKGTVMAIPRDGEPLRAGRTLDKQGPLPRSTAAR